VKNSIHSSVRTRHLGFRKRDGSFCTADGAERERERERERETEITLMLSFACNSVSLLAVVRDIWYCFLGFICPSDKGRYCCRCLKDFCCGRSIR
jgi:hypothetical protein